MAQEAKVFRNPRRTLGIYPPMRVTGVPGKRGYRLRGWLRIGMCLLALCWPLLATAAPVLTSVPPSHACCRRNGEHHCERPPSSDTSIGAVCPQAGKRLKFAGAKSARPQLLVRFALPVLTGTLAVAPGETSYLFTLFSISPRAPPFA